MKMPFPQYARVAGLIALATLTPSFSHAAADLYIKDCPADTGVEPDPVCPVVYLSEDIWVRQTPISGYQLAPFVADPAWLTALSPLHQNPEYRDPKYSRPNYVYVRVRNRGNTASSGNERLRVYWAKASTGLGWPSQWVDYMANHCGPSELYGIEITKPRKNAATATAAERTDYVNAINAIDGASYQWVMDGVTYWDKQDQIHQLAPEHGTPAFLPWHREMLSRYEVLLREANPIVTLLYWDWTTDPANSTGGFDLMTASFMGTANGVLGAPFASLHANGVCANSRNGFVLPGGPNCNMNFNNWTFPPPSIYRSKSPGSPGVSSDGTVLSPTLYENFDNMEGNPHGNAHVYMSGNMGSIPTATEDPFFFLLHANCDRLWAQWQRSNNLAYLSRLNPATAYDGASGHARINANMQPWDGSSSIAPWAPGAGSYTYAKTPKDPSVVFAPVYDTAPLRIPVLQAGESIVFEIPWYPPNPADFACFGADQGHVCLLARIETSTAAPYGMTFPETANIGDNVRNNNNIAWKNITVQDNFPGLFFVGTILIRNLAREIAPTRLQLRVPPEERNNPILAQGGVFLDLGRELFERWMRAGGKGQGIEHMADGRVQIFSPDAFLADIPLEPEEVQQVRLQLQLDPQYRHPDGRTFSLDMEQYGTPANPDQFIGGQRFTYDFNKLTLVAKGSHWRYLDTGEYPGDEWTSPDYDDSRWLSGQAELGFGDYPATTIDGGPADKRYVTTWFRRRFTVPDPSIYRSLVLSLKLDDGCIIYLNGKEIYRANLPANAGPGTFATVDVRGVREETCFIIPLPNDVEALQRGENVLAVEVHQSSPTSEDLSFDLELAANTLPLAVLAPPSIAIVAPDFGSLHLAGQPIDIRADAVDPLGDIASVIFFVDGQRVGTDDDPPYTATWQDTGTKPGPHQISALALDSDGNGTIAYVTIQVLDNVPPVVEITQPASGTTLNSSNRVLVAASAFDVGGTVQRVDFYLRHHHAFGIGDLVASDTTAPFEADLGMLVPEHWVITAVATDNGGANGMSLPVEVMVVGTAERPRLTLQWMSNHAMVGWTPANAILQHADTPLGPWTDLNGAANPLVVMPTGRAKFYRAYLP